MSDPLPSGMGLYADLLAGSAAKSSDGSTISSAPVRYNLKPQVSASPAPKKKDAALQFQPMVKRPQPKGKKSGAAHAWAASTNNAAVVAPTETTKSTSQGSKIEYWLEKGNDHNYVRPKPKWYRDKKNKKKQQQHEEVREHNWDDVYDPMEPNNYRAYKGSEEQYRDICEWKDRLYFRARGIKPQKTPEEATPPAMNRMFAPPTLYETTSSNTETTTFHEDATGEDAFARRARMAATAFPPPPQPSSDHIPPPPPPPLQSKVTQQAPPPDVAAKQAEVLAKLAAVKAKIMASKPISNPSSVENLTPPPPHSNHAGLGSMVPSQPYPTEDPGTSPSPPRHTGLGNVVSSTDEKLASSAPSSAAGPGSSGTYEPVQDTAPEQAPNIEYSAPAGTISRAPVRYAVPEQPQSHEPDNQQEASIEAKPKSRKEGFGRRMLEKQGWKEGHGLGANSEGITTAIVAQAQKRKKLPDAEGGGWAPRNMGKIVGGKRRKVDGNEAEPAMSNVIKLPGMLKGLDVKHEIEEKNLQQELGEWFDKNYGKVERVVIWREEQGGDNEVNASFYDTSKFDRGEYA